MSRDPKIDRAQGVRQDRESLPHCANVAPVNRFEEVRFHAVKHAAEFSETRRSENPLIVAPGRFCRIWLTEMLRYGIERSLYLINIETVIRRAPDGRAETGAAKGLRVGWAYYTIH